MLQHSVINKRSEQISREFFSEHPLVTEYRDERQRGEQRLLSHSPRQDNTHTESGLKNYFQVLILKEFCDFFFSNQNHANQRKEHKKLLSFALAKKCNKARWNQVNNETVIWTLTGEC